MIFNFKKAQVLALLRALGLSPCRIKYKLLKGPSPYKGPKSISKTIHRGLSLF